MMCDTADRDHEQDRSDSAGEEGPGSDEDADRAEFAALLEDSAEDLYENAPCGYLSTLLDGHIAKINSTLLGWLGYTRGQLVGRKRFADLLTVGGRLYHETHFAPLLAMQGRVSGIALELKAADGSRLPVLVTSVVKTGEDDQPLMIRTTVFDARDRRAYEQELLRARKQAEQARVEAELAHRAAEAERARLHQVLAILQNSLLPPVLPQVPGLEAAAYYHTASADELGGDFYDLFALGDGRWAFFLGDVCGKGPAAAAVTSLVRFTLRATCRQVADPVSVLRILDAELQEHYGAIDPRYCTVLVGMLTPHGSSFTAVLASGGHPPALLLRADGSADVLSTPGGTLVGILPQPHFVPATATLAPGDTLLLYTDGLTEARTNAGPRYSETDLHAFARSLAPAGARPTIAALAGLMENFGDGLDDDTALLALGVPAATDPSDTR